MIEDFQSRKLDATVKELRLCVVRSFERKGHRIGEGDYLVTTTYHGKMYDLRPDSKRKGYYLRGAKPIGNFATWKSFGPNDLEIAQDASSVAKKSKRELCYLIGPLGFIPVLGVDAEISDEMVQLVMHGNGDDVSVVSSVSSVE